MVIRAHQHLHSLSDVPMSAIRKSFVLLSCTFLGLICGTLYLYSSYSPQLALRLEYSATDSSSIALFGNLGVAIAGPIAGIVVDKKGYTYALLTGGTAIVLGYYGLRDQFIRGASNLPLLCLLLFLIGAGSTFINSTCLKCCAVSFPRIRGVVTSLPLALYGLLAMFYSVVISVYYPGDTAGFLRFLIVSVAVIFTFCAPHVMLCDRRVSEPRRNPESIQMSNVGPKIDSDPMRYHGLHHLSELSGVELLKSPRFWLIFVATGATASLGQMYIYSVGYMVKALVLNTFSTEGMSEIPPIEIVIQQEQQVQVGLLSMTNCIGRLSAGILGDIISQSFHLPRGLLLFIPSIGLLATQIMGLNFTEPSQLAVASICTGFFYGFTFCIMPIIVGDVFGMENFSGNWGLVGLAPILPSFFLTSLFGKVYDSHTILNATGASVCVLGKFCYTQIFKITLAVSLIGCLVVSIINFGERYIASRDLLTRTRGASVSKKPE